MPSLHRISLVAMTALVSAAPLHAEKVVRVIWNVGEGTYHYARTEEIGDLGADGWRFPQLEKGRYQGFDEFHRGDRIVSRGDLVRVYITNYNPIAHVPAAARVTGLEDRAPLIGTLLAAVIQSLLTGTLPQIPPGAVAGLRFMAESPASDILEPCKKYTGEEQRLCEALVRIEKDTDSLKAELSSYFSLSAGWDPRSLAEVLTEFPERSFGTFHAPDAWRLLQDRLADVEVPYDRIRPLMEQARHVRRTLERIETSLRRFDAEYLSWELSHPYGKLNGFPERRKAAGDLHARIKEAVQPELDFVKACDDLFSAMQEALDTSKPCLHESETNLDAICHEESRYVVEIAETAETRNAVLLLDLPFQPQDEKDLRREYRYLALRTDESVRFFTSLGIAGNNLDFKTLQVVQTVPDDGSELQNEIQISDDEDFRTVTGSVLGHLGGLRLGFREAALYFTFGTTPDKNVFRNWIIAGSVYFPRFRSVVTLGTLLAKGTSEDDLTAQIAEYEAFGDTVDVTALPSVESWHAAFFLSVSVSIFQ